MSDFAGRAEAEENRYVFEILSALRADFVAALSAGEYGSKSAAGLWLAALESPALAIRQRDLPRAPSLELYVLPNGGGQHIVLWLCIMPRNATTLTNLFKTWS